MLSFVIRGSKGDLYDVSFDRSGDNLTATCTCRAGEMGMYCKHRFQLMDGDITNLISDNASAVNELPGLIADTDVAHYLLRLRAAQVCFDAAKKELSDIKKALAKAMRD